MTSEDSAGRPPEMPRSAGPGEQPAWDQDEADLILGQYVVVGITYLAPDGVTVTSQVQCHGRVTKADEQGIALVCEGTTWRGQTMTFPPDPRAFYPATPGDYRLPSTNEVVKNPDLVTSWTLTEPSQPS